MAMVVASLGVAPRPGHQGPHLPQLQPYMGDSATSLAAHAAEDPALPGLPRTSTEVCHHVLPLTLPPACLSRHCPQVAGEETEAQSSEAVCLGSQMLEVAGLSGSRASPCPPRHTPMTWTLSPQLGDDPPSIGGTNVPGEIHRLGATPAGHTDGSTPRSISPVDPHPQRPRRARPQHPVAPAAGPSLWCLLAGVLQGGQKLLRGQGVPSAQGCHQEVHVVEQQDVVTAVLLGHRQDVLPPLTHGHP